MTREGLRLLGVEKRQDSLERRQDSFERFVRAYIESNDRRMTEQKADMQEIKADMREMRAELKAIGRHTQNLSVAAIAGIGAISVAVIGFIWAMATR